MENVSLNIEKLLLYGEKKLFLSVEGKAFARNALMELLQSEPSTELEPIDVDAIDPQEVLDVLTRHALDNEIIDEDAASKFPAKLMNLVMPSQDDVRHTYERLQLDHGRKEAKAYLLCVAEGSLHVKKPDPRTVAWYVNDGKRNFALVLPVSDRNPEAEEGFYPRCPYCLENLGFCGLPGESAQYTKRVLPLELGDEIWYLSYVEERYYDEEFVVSCSKHRPSGDGRYLFRMLDIAEKFPDDFVAIDGEDSIHDHLFGGKMILPYFKSPIKKVVKSGDLSIEIPDWCFSFLRVSGYDKQEVLRTASKIVKYWKNYKPENIVYPSAHCTVDKYVVDICLLKGDKPNVLFEKPGYLDVLGMFILPCRAHRDTFGLVDALTCEKIDFAGVNDSPELSRYMDWIIQIAAARGAGLTRDQARDSVFSLMGETCIQTTVDFSLTEKELQKVATEALKQP